MKRKANQQPARMPQSSLTRSVEFALQTRAAGRCFQQFLVLLYLCFPSPSHSQEFTSPEALQTLDITGLSADDVRSVLGEPDSRDESGQTERWQYGTSQIFLAAGHVVAWTNAAALMERRDQIEVQKSVQKQNRPEKETYMGWKPSSDATPRAVIDDLLGLRVPADPTAQEKSAEVAPLEVEQDDIESLFR